MEERAKRHPSQETPQEAVNRGESKVAGRILRFLFTCANVRLRIDTPGFHCRGTLILLHVWALILRGCNAFCTRRSVSIKMQISLPTVDKTKTGRGKKKRKRKRKTHLGGCSQECAAPKRYEHSRSQEVECLRAFLLLGERNLQNMEPFNNAEMRSSLQEVQIVGAREQGKPSHHRLNKARGKVERERRKEYTMRRTEESARTPAAIILSF